MNPAHRAIPDLDALLELVREQSTHRGSKLHGEQHWQAVARTGLRLIEAGVSCDPVLLLCFSMLHDHRRLDDGDDPLHGPRAAANLSEFSGLLNLTDRQWELLTRACHDHTAVIHDPDPTVGACFDADRLNLMRVGITPDARYLNHPQSRRTEMINRCSRAVFDGASWHQLLADYASARRLPRTPP